MILLYLFVLCVSTVLFFFCIFGGISIGTDWYTEEIENSYDLRSYVSSIFVLLIISVFSLFGTIVFGGVSVYVFMTILRILGVSNE